MNLHPSVWILLPVSLPSSWCDVPVCFDPAVSRFKQTLFSVQTRGRCRTTTSLKYWIALSCGNKLLMATQDASCQPVSETNQELDSKWRHCHVPCLWAEIVLNTSRWKRRTYHTREESFKDSWLQRQWCGLCSVFPLGTCHIKVIPASHAVIRVV